MTLRFTVRPQGPQQRGPFGLLSVPEDRPLSESALFAGYRHAEDPPMPDRPEPVQNTDVIFRLEAALRFARSGPDGRTAGRTLQLYRVAADVASRNVATKLHRSQQAITNMELRGADEDVVARFIVAVDELTRADR